MTNLYFVIAIIANLICIIRGKLVCKEADVVKDFQKDAFLGTWYGAIRNPTVYDVTSKCATYNVTSLTPDTIHLNITSKNIYSDNTIPISVFLKHTVDSHTGSFKVDVTRHKLIGSFNIGLIDVYYDKYAIFQSCDIAEEIEYIWILTRNRIVTDKQFEELYDNLKAKGIKSEYLIKVHQTNCTSE